MIHLSRALVFVAAAFATGLSLGATPALAQTQEQHDWCYDDNATDPQTIEGCSALINSGKYSGGDLAIVQMNRGLGYLHTKQYSLALVDFSQAIALNPSYAEAFDNRGVTFDGLRQYDLAIKDFDQTIRLKPTALAYNNRGYVYYEMGNLDHALDDLNSAIGMDASFGRAYVNRGVVHAAKKDCTAAVADFAGAQKVKWDFTLGDEVRKACGAAVAGFP